MTAASDGGLDLSADFSAGWRPRDAALAPVPGGTLHKVELRAAHTEAEVAPGVKQQMWTFGGSAPGPTLHGKVGDVFEVTLVNDDTGMGHGVDFHAGSLAPDKPMRTIQPGERLVYRFRAERAGAWLYHCSTSPMLQHMGNGMYGAVIIDPPGLKKVDHEYVLVSSELYLGTPGSTAQVKKMRHDTPDAWVFNGIADQYSQRPLKAKAGERVRFWVVAAGPSDGIAFHVVGTVFDTVYKEGAYLLRPRQAGGSQVLDLATAQGGFVETVFPAAGHYAFVDHDMRHAEAGAHGMVEVSD
jgi:nitrite reductase (NO-forming)